MENAVSEQAVDEVVVNVEENEFSNGPNEEIPPPPSPTVSLKVLMDERPLPTSPVVHRRFKAIDTYEVPEDAPRASHMPKRIRRVQKGTLSVHVEAQKLLVCLFFNT